MKLFTTIIRKSNFSYRHNFAYTKLIFPKQNFCSQNQIQSLRNKYIGNTFSILKYQSKEKFSANDFRDLELVLTPLQEIKDKEKLKNEVLPDAYRTLIILSKQNRLKSSILIEICLNIFNSLKGDEFPFFLVPEFLFHLNLFDAPKKKKIIQSLPDSFLGDCETNFYEKAIILNLKELVDMSLLMKMFQVSNNFHPYLEKTILHKLEDVEQDPECSHYIGCLAAIYRDCYSLDTYLSPFLKKVGFLINENFISSRELYQILYKVNHFMGALRYDSLTPSDQNISYQIELFLAKIRDYLFDVANQATDFKLLHMILRLCSHFKFANHFYRNGVFLGNLIVEATTAKENTFKFEEWNHILGISSKKFITLQPHTLKQLSIIAINGINSAKSCQELSRILGFFIYKYKEDNRHAILTLLALKLVEVCATENPSSVFAYCYTKLKELNASNLLLDSLYDVLQSKQIADCKKKIVDKEEDEVSSEDETVENK